MDDVRHSEVHSDWHLGRVLDRRFRGDLSMTPASVVTDDEVERVARAIFDDDPQWERFPGIYREPYHRKARAALAASDRDVLVAALREARTIVASDAAACKAFAGPGETSEPERVLAVIDAALIPLGGE